MREEIGAGRSPGANRGRRGTPIDESMINMVGDGNVIIDSDGTQRTLTADDIRRGGMGNGGADDIIKRRMDQDPEYRNRMNRDIGDDNMDFKMPDRVEQRRQEMMERRKQFEERRRQDPRRMGEDDDFMKNMRDGGRMRNPEEMRKMMQEREERIRKARDESL